MLEMLGSPPGLAVRTGKYSMMENNGLCYHRFRPAYPINIYISHFTVVKGTPQFPTVRVFPNNLLDLFFNLGDENLGVQQSADDFHFNQTIISGVRSNYLQIFPGKFFFIAGLRFTLFGFHHLFKMPGKEICDGNFSAGDVLGKEIISLWNQLGDSDDICTLINVMHDWVFEKIKKSEVMPRSWQRIEALLRNSKCNIRKELPGLMGYSYKHSLKLFREICGLDPKTVQRVYRINSLLTDPEILKSPNWSGLSFQFGYSDQSHLIKEFKLYTGFTPTEFLANHPKDFLVKQLG